MQLTLLSGTKLYLTNPALSASAVWGFIPWRSSGAPTVDVANTWNVASGYYVFFPAANRGSGWPQFVSKLSQQMENGTNRRFGFFDTQGNGLAFLSVSGTGNEQALTVGATFAFRNIKLQVSPIQSKVSATYDNASSTFKIAKLSSGGVDSAVWMTSGANGVHKIYPLGDLNIPVSGPTPGTLMTKLALSLEDQAAVETGPMYFAPPSNGGPLTALRYPNFIGSGSSQKIAVTAYADLALPVDVTRTYFELNDPELKTAFSSSIGRQISLAPRSGSAAPDGLSARFVLSDRSVSQVGDNAAYYLTPLGSFTVGMTGTAAAGELLCAYSATETFAFSRGDVLRFVPGNPAYRENTPATPEAPAAYLNNKATTSWLGLTSSTPAQNTYYSQPQGSPIYESNGQSGGGENGAYKAYQLKFKKIDAWPAQGSAVAATATPTPTPLVPMVPYGGLPTSDDAVVAQYQVMESKGINPARRLALKSASETKSFAPLADTTRATAVDSLVYNMTPLGLLGGFDQASVWRSTKFALSGSEKDKTLQFEDMQDALRSALYQNQIFLVIDQDISGANKLFTFGELDATVELAAWFFDLQLQGKDPDGVPPILLLKLFRDKTVKELVDDRAVWEDATTFSSDPPERQTQLQKIIQEAEDAVAADPNSVYSNFVTIVNDPAFAGLIAVNTALKLNELPPVIRALLGGMTKADGTSNIAAFRAHHVGVMISDTGNTSSVSLDSSSIFALVDYEDTSTSNISLSVRTVEPSERAIPSIYAGNASGLDYYGFKVIYLRALFENNALTSFAAEVDLTVNNLFAVGVNLGNNGAGNNGGGNGDGDNIVKIMGSYSEHDGAQTYSFVATKTYEFTFDNNTYLKNLTFDKVQFSATEENTGAGSGTGNGTSKISSRFAIWGSMEFNKLEFLDMFSFKKLSFADLGINMSYLLTVVEGQPPVTSDLSLWFSPGNLRFDFGDTEQRVDNDSMLALLPFKLQSFLYSEKGQSISELNFFGISLGSFGANTDPTFNFALIFDLDLGSLGALVSSLSAFKFSVLLGWQPPTGSTPNALVFGVQMPEADGKLEINIEGVLKISIEEFQLKYNKDTADKLLVLALHNSYMEILGTRLPPGNIFFDFAMFAPTKGENKIGWIAALNNKEEEGEGTRAVGVSMDDPLDAARQLALAQNGNGDGGSKLLKLDYIGVGQRVGPEENLDNFDAFLEYMRTDFWAAVKSGEYGKVYRPDGGWIVVTNIELLELVGLGFVFYDTTPFYSLKIYITKAQLKGLSFEITYTKVSDDVGLFFINFTLPDMLRTFQAGAASITLPALKLSLYTNGDFKIDLGFPANDDWTVCFRVEAMAGPVPVTGSGGFYIAKLSSATDNTFTEKYDTILAAGFGARLGVGKNFTAGPFKAGVSLTFFGIIEGKIGYYAYDGTEDVVKWLTDPKALALQGQFGIIGELYGTLDFAIIKASVNVRIQASVGLQLILQDGLGGDILLYVEASVSVSVSVRIDLGLFSISVSFSFRATFRFEWKLLNSGNSNAVQKLVFSAEWAALTTELWNPGYPLQQGLTRTLATLMTPEITSVWSNPTATGVPWFVVSLTMEYLVDPTTVTDPSQFKPFENLAAQVVAWALNASLGLASWSDTVTQEQIDALNQDPDKLVGGLSYTTLIAGLSKMFALGVTGVPPADGKTATEDKEIKYATVFPMLPFLGLKTTGRSSDFNYVFQDKSQVSQQWVATELQDYFAQLYTNITSGNFEALIPADVTTVPLIQSIFLDWFQALTRSTVNALLTQMQNDGKDNGKLKDVYLAAVKSGQIKNVAGQMSQFFRSGLRLPKTAGMDLPAGSLDATNPLYALIWQEFPVGGFADGKQYVVNLVADNNQTWVSVDAKWTLLSSDVAPYAVPRTSVSIPGTPVPIQVLQTGPQAYSLANPITWKPTGGTATTLRPLSSAMNAALKVSSPLTVKLLSRETTKAYDLETNPVPPANVKWALSIEMLVRKVPLGGGVFLPSTYALGAADLATQNAMRDLLTALGSTPSLVKSIDLLYQNSSDSSGLISSPTPKQLFVLRINTTTQSVPPPSTMLMAVEGRKTAVGADTSDPFGFLQILEQSSVTNQTGYFLTFEAADGSSLPSALFGPQTFAPVTFLFELNVPLATDVYSLARYINAVVLANTVDGQLYYAETTNAADETSYVSMAAGSASVELSRKEPGQQTVTDKLAQLYSLVAFQVPASAGFIASNLSVPSGPQKQEETDQYQHWRLSAPLYKLATANQGSADPNRYASIGDSYSIETLVVDAFGNAFGGVQTAVANKPNLYFDDLIPMGNWTGVRSIFNFQAWSSPTDDTVCKSLNTGPVTGTPQKNQFSVYLCPSKDSLPLPNSQSAVTTAALYQTIIDQLTAPSVTLFVTTNLNSTKSDIDLSADQTKAVLDILRSVKNYLDGGTGDLGSVTLTVTVPGSSDNLALVFEIQADFGTKRTDHVSPDVANYPNAYRVTTNVPPQSASNNLSELAADFSAAFPAFGLATGPADATDVSVGTPALAEADDDETAASQPKGLWAVSKKVTDLTLSNTVRYYLAPKPLDTRLRSGTVPLPNNLPALSSLPKERTFNDVDLDNIARTTFAAIDLALGAENSSNMFQVSRDSYSKTAYAREDIADRYADNEVTWLLNDSTFIGDGSDLCQGQDQMAQQMRAALSSAYAVNTIVQTKVTFNQALPASMGNRLQLFGQMQRPPDSNSNGQDAGGFGLGTARVDVPSGSGGQTTTTTFLYGVTDQKIEDNRYQEFQLEWAVSHLQVFLEDREIDYCEHGEAAQSSIWLQLINSFASPPKMGDTIIPLAFREYPTPPTSVVQTAKRDTESSGTTLADQTRWLYTTTYQARLLAADEITLQLIYNTGGSTGSAQLFGAEDGAGEEPAETYTLFEALARFQAGYEILQPQMSPISTNTPVDVLTAFATLVTQLANNSNWAPISQRSMFGGSTPTYTLEQDVVTDSPTKENSSERLITLTPDPLAVQPNPWVGDKCVTALDPATMKPYPGETESCSTPGQKIVTHTYVPDPPLSGNFVTHQVKVKGLTTLLYENGNSGIGTRRNATLYKDVNVLSKPEFIYQTPIVAPTNALTPFVDNPTPVQIYPIVVTDKGLDLGDYVRRTLEAMMGLTEGDTAFSESSEGTSTPANRRLKIDARYGFPIGSPSGSSEEAKYFVPLAPSVLVRSFDLPVDGLQNALKEWVGQSGDPGSSGIKPYAAVLADWLQKSGLPLGQPASPDAPPPGAILVFDVTLYSQLGSGSNQLPLLRLSDLRLELSVVAAPASAAV